MSENDKIIAFVHRNLGLDDRRGCMSLFIDEQRFDLTLDEARSIRDGLNDAIAFEERVEGLRERTKDVREKADTGEILRAL